MRGLKCFILLLPPSILPIVISLPQDVLLEEDLKADMEKIFEPIFNLPLSQPKSREEWFGKAFFNDLSHPIHQAGILTDSSFRPVDERGDLILENVWVAGSILAHHHCIDEKSREGIEIATGYVAAKQALEK